VGIAGELGHVFGAFLPNHTLNSGAGLALVSRIG
jgi:hypothetical protein